MRNLLPIRRFFAQPMTYDTAAVPPVIKWPLVAGKQAADEGIRASKDRPDCLRIVTSSNRQTMETRNLTRGKVKSGDGSVFVGRRAPKLDAGQCRSKVPV